MIGPNGAGKTTFFNLLTKFLHPTTGRIAFNGTRHHRRKNRPRQARRGIVRSFQISAVFPHLTVLENVRAGLQRNLGTLSFLEARKHGVARVQRARPPTAGPKSTCRLRRRADGQPALRAAQLELATTLALEPELMLLDEPTQGMGHEDVDRVTR